MRIKSAVICFFLFIAGMLQAQFLSNPSFEGNGVDNMPPENWPSCQGSPDNPPLAEEILVELPASHGERYLSMRARGDIPNPDFEYHRGIRDQVATQLLKPLQLGMRYELSIDLATDYEVILFQMITAMDHAQLRIWGGNGPCSQTELLASSDAIMNTDWETFHICFTPKENNYTWFFLEADFIDNDTLNGIILADNLEITEVGGVDTAYSSEIVMPGDTIMLEAFNSENYVWTPTEDLSCNDCQFPSFIYSDQQSYIVELQNTNSCYKYQKFGFVPPTCDMLTGYYATQQFDTVITYGEPIELEVPYGDRFEWIPHDDLSCYDCGSQVVYPKQSTRYSCVAINEYDCELEFTFDVGVEIKVPNAITPNYDQVNDNFEVLALPENSKLKIIDRNGRVVYETDNYQNNWPMDGRNKIPLQTDTYWYLLECPEMEPVQGYVLVKF